MEALSNSQESLSDTAELLVMDRQGEHMASYSTNQHEGENVTLGVNEDGASGNGIGTSVAPSTAPPDGGNSIYVFVASLMAAIGGVLFGYDVGIISGALLQLKVDFSLSCIERELVVSTMLLGAVIGSLSGGFIVDYFGRRYAIMVNAGIFIIGALVLALSPNYSVLIVGRLVVGFAVSLSAIGECVYISEIAPPTKRGLLVSLNELGITVGLLLAYLVNYLFICVGAGWRYMFALSIVPALVQGIGMFFLPPSPRHLMLKRKEQQAQEVLQKLRGYSNVTVEWNAIKASVNKDGQSFFDLFRGADNMRGRLLIGCGLVLFQQFTGQPNVLYYAPTIFLSIGFESDTSATLATVGLGVIKVLATVCALLSVDRTGRRTFLMFGGCCMGISIFLLGVGTLSLPHRDVRPCQNQNLTSPGVSRYQGCEPVTSGAGPEIGNLSSQSPAFAAGFDIFPVSTTHIPAQRERRDMNSSGSNYPPFVMGVDVIYDDNNTSGKTNSTVLFNSADTLSVEKNRTVDAPEWNVSPWTKWLSMVALMVYVAAFAVGFGPVTWLVLSEIFPSSIKGRAIAFATVMNWGSNVIISLTFLDIMNGLGASWTFIMYGIICAMSVAFIFAFVPETKNRSLEIISEELRDRGENNCTFTVCCQSLMFSSQPADVELQKVPVLQRQYGSTAEGDIPEDE
ncbi:solute carrier family 2, facilitated glucose transporter member 10 isoform X2 [Lingula anatina]|uniref:Solute carrier family 2, facilitated glucose transporter member 10 isoform X2 n=1 Tax=Lingula anatina TaxID=7574 RepID=A0A1S3H5H9_LINAN|nr:solute carrier family 2, facilitated glucose transporter member 10 isoform X2 [Lingula anatina]|eukprot:XP_013380389.1 solute carrier family 2, facilitated glucose transporter member 10 isoform X2 [Lingula anatina]